MLVNVISAASRKLQRAARSSLHAEVQGAFNDIEEQYYCEAVWADIHTPGGIDLIWWETAVRNHTMSLGVTGCKGLYGGTKNKSMSSVGCLADKRCGIEVLARKQSMNRAGTLLACTHSDAMPADGITQGPQPRSWPLGITRPAATG